jgi:hypothetical protein
MIHRINSVAPDLDDRVIKPNQARDAKNLRFGASTDDSNMSGGVMVNGNVYVSNTLPQTGVCQVVGTLADLENQVVYFCLYNSEGRHGVYRIKTVNNIDVVEAILGGTVNTGSWLNFQFDMEVSMTSIDGKLYWTDNLNQPRMVNIEKGIRTQLYLAGAGPGDDVYPATPQEWHYTQIKRAPQEPLDFTINGSAPFFSLKNASKDYDNIFGKDYGWQFSYYYIYDNNEESRIAPESIVVWYNVNLTMTIPSRELLSYVQNISLIKKIVFIYRAKNDGQWNVLKTVFNTQNYNGSITIDNIDLLPATPVSSNITSNLFDSVPRLSATNEIAQNRINHGNYLIDYPNWTGLNLNLSVLVSPVENKSRSVTVQELVWVPPTNEGYVDPFVSGAEGIPEYIPGYYQTVTRTILVTDEFLNFGNRTFYRGYYNVGIELLDEWGRRIAVVNQKSIEIPNYIYKGIRKGPLQLIGFTPLVWNEDKNNCFKIKYDITGQFPDWCKYWRVVYSKNQSVNYFQKSICKVYYWYTSDDVDLLSVIYAGNVGSNDKTYTITGIAIELSGGEPFLFTSEEEQYVAIAQEYFTTPVDPTVEQLNPPLKDYKIKKQIGNVLYIEDIDPVLYPGWALQTGGNQSVEKDWYPLYYQVYLYSKKKSADEFYYQSTAVKMVGDALSGYLYGDSYLNVFKKENKGSTRQVINFTFNQSNNSWRTESDPVTVIQTNTIETTGYAVSMNIRDIYSQDWISDIGQLNIVNEDQKEVRIKNGICFSDTLIAGSQINGLSKFDPLDVRQAPFENGPITALVTTNATQREPGVMLAIGTYGVSSFYYDSVQLTNVDGTTNIAVSDRYLASQRPLQGQFGCSQLRSVTKTPLAAVYWWSDVVNDFIRYSNAGLERLGLTYLFGNKLRNEVSGKKVCTTYDYITDEVILTPALGQSFVFSERYKTFQGMREYINLNGATPDRGISISERMYHFVNGMPWVTTAQTPKNTFFSLVKNPELILVTNESPAVVKQWNQIKVYGPKPTSVALISGDAEGFVRQSYINSTWWIQRKGEYDAAIRRDITSGNGMTGKIMESRILYSTFVFDAASFEKLNFIEIKSNMSVVQ